MAPKRRPAARKRKTKPASPRSPTPPPPSPETPNPAELPPPEANPPTVGIEYPEQQLSDTDNVDTAGSNFASDEDDLIATATTSAATRKKNKPKTKSARILTIEEEDEVIEWLKSNRFLYDKTSIDFKNRDKKERTWHEMEQRMKLNPGDLQRWYTSLRTTYVKEVKKRENTTRSGAGVGDGLLTSRTSWLLEKFEFVKPFVCQARGTKGSQIKKPDRYSDCSESSVPSITTMESTPQSVTTSSTTTKISDCLEKVSQQLAVPKSDIEKTCDFLSTLMAKMTPSCLEDFTNETIFKAMEYVKQSKQEQRQTQQPPRDDFIQPSQLSSTFTDPSQQVNRQTLPQFTQLQPQQQTAVGNNRPSIRPTTSSMSFRHRQPQQMSTDRDYIIARNLSASNPPADVLQQYGRYQWAELQPTNLQPILMGQQQQTVYSTHTTSQTPSAIESTATDTTSVLTDAYETINPETPFI
ncbi:uncharacterized protein [Mytilus edulis]|uniref:uncharacterized protein n=1 Tax=Mytilus edulis TaxID=6550 RepID=UPI0039EFFD28